MIYKELHLLIPEIDRAFEAFYDTLLNELNLTEFFESDAQIRSLVERQKQHFEAMLRSPRTTVEAAYVKMGELHYDLRIPYVDFMKGTEVLEKHFVRHACSVSCSLTLLQEIYGFFDVVKSYTAKGYLNRMIAEDRRDIGLFFENLSSDEETDLPRKVVLQKIEWLGNLLDAIENDGDCDPETCGQIFDTWLEEASFLTEEKKAFFEAYHKRIQINTQTLFYFLKKHEYLEILPLYSTLLDIYKLSLLLNNSIIYEYATHLIGDLKVDKMTGLYRREAFDQFLKKELEYARRYDDYGFVVAFVDIDDFKFINDRFGHYTGDNVIQRVGDVIQNNIRASDSGFRIGGDEFAILLKNISVEEAEQVCRKIHEKVNVLGLTCDNGEPLRVGLSIGVLSSTEDAFESITGIVKSVDRKLYEAKRQGKNTIVI